MTADQLRKSILQQAIQGKLVPQDPNDEPASVLLEKIQAEKKRLIKEKKIKPNKNESIIFRGEDNRHYEKLPSGTVICIEEEVPFEVPEGWRWARLNTVCFPLKYGTASKSIKNGNIAVLRMGNIQQGNIDYSNLVFSNNEQDNQQYLLQENDLLFNRTNSPELVGKTGIYKGEMPAIYAGYLILIRVMCMNAEYVNYIMNSEYQRNYCQTVKTNGVSQSNINAEKIGNLLLPIPPYNEQLRIVEKIKKVIPFVENHSKYEIESRNLDDDVFKQLKRSILQSAIQGKLLPQRPQDEPASKLLERIREEKKRLVKEKKIKVDKLDSTIFKGDDNKYYERIGKNTVCIDEEIPFEIPESWIWSRGSQCFKPMASAKPEGERFEYIDIDAVNNKLNTIERPKLIETVKAPSRASRKICEGDILFSMVRPYLRNIAYVSKQYEHCIASTGFFVFKPSKLFYPKFLYWLLLSPYVIDGLNQFMKGDNSPSINGDNVEQFLYPIPPVEEQIRIVKHLQNILNIVRD